MRKPDTTAWTWPYHLDLVIPVFVAISVLLHAPYPLLAPIPLFFIVVPLLDRLPACRRIKVYERRTDHRPTVTGGKIFLHTATVAATMGLSLFDVSRKPDRWWIYAIIGAFWWMAYCMGVIHEAIHLRRRTPAHLLARVILTSFGHQGFIVQHRTVHHKAFGLRTDPDTAFFNEGAYEFVRRSLPHRFRFASRSYVITTAFVASLGLLLGWPAACFWVAQSALGAIVFQVAVYHQHYGLNREGATPEGLRYHSWVDHGFFVNHIFFGVGLHDEHHRRPYVSDHAPLTLPLPLPWTVLLSFVPPIWFWVMNGRIPPAARLHAAGRFAG